MNLQHTNSDGATQGDSKLADISGGNLSNTGLKLDFRGI